MHWFTKYFRGITRKQRSRKCFIAGVIPIVVSVPKVIARTAVPKLNLVHPGVLHLLVSILYTATAVVSRVMQAELIDFSLFVALGVGHAMIDLVERITVTMRDHIWEYAYKLLSRCSRSQTRDFHAGKARTPRSMRFVADISIQLLLTEAGALVSSVGFIQLYKFMYPDQNEDYFSDLIWEFIKRCFTGLAIDVVFQHHFCVAASDVIQRCRVTSLEYKQVAIPCYHKRSLYGFGVFVLLRVPISYS
ncbi:hypothetical protein OS493_013368 [Desmophyllum pertusum]|uniref:Uncharacterized protein n=1 Tax=Desmophyllum pertusum TaxID=174260 RepID=A0A9W9YDH9_9CNID|nr:hypothetical protein OS493_013368 [Desmophyllum pertusum]